MADQSFEQYLEARAVNGDDYMYATWSRSPKNFPRDGGEMMLDIFADYGFDPLAMSHADVITLASRWVQDHAGVPDDVVVTASHLETVIELLQRREVSDGSR